jgi:NitT/TauT family transport system permease protein
MKLEQAVTLSTIKEGLKRPLPLPAGEPLERPLRLHERLWRMDAFRKALILALLALGWELYAARMDNPLLVPTFSASMAALVEALLHEELLFKALTSLKVLLCGYAGGIVAAAILTFIAISSRLGSDLLETLTSMFNPLPAIALLPLALIWFGLGAPSMIFVLIHSVLWPIALNTHAGFTGVSPTLRMVGRNYGLRGLPFVVKILIPAALPNILTGLKVGWAFAWRTLIASELVFGVSSGSGGLGWYIYEKKNQLEIASVFAGLFSVILIGIIVENVVFRTLERLTVNRWGMRH